MRLSDRRLNVSAYAAVLESDFCPAYFRERSVDDNRNRL
ncbi:hypothetical protein Z945_2111 [Sulfitobacter noctilucae]|nr:hypothetical protein Z945_2111 [Sulfitobacter noctilucae]